MIAAAIGAAGKYLFDPQRGRIRRAKLGQRIGRRREAQHELVQQSDPPPPPPLGPDEMLTAKVESEVLSQGKYPKGAINVKSLDGIVALRGVCESRRQIDELEQEVRKVKGVFSVRNYLRTPTDP